MLAKGASRQTPDAESELVKREQEAVEACRKLQRKAREKSDIFQDHCVKRILGINGLELYPSHGYYIIVF